MTSFHPIVSPPENTSFSSGMGAKPKSAILYSTGRSVSIATTTLEPTYPWDYDLDPDDDDDDGLDDYDDESEDPEDTEDNLGGRSYMINQEEEDYQHPSLETSRTRNLFFTTFSTVEIGRKR